MAETPSEDKKPVWRLGKIDFGGPWCPKEKMDAAVLDAVISRLKNFESMTWDQINNSGSHFISISDIIGDAQKRLMALKIDDVDELYSLRFEGKPRLWGIRDRNIFSALWWDPEHEICPSQKKHT